MSNQELELKVKEILAIENFFDMVEATVAFEKEYKQSSFYKNTKMPLTKVIKGSKAWYALQMGDIEKKVQNFINNLDLTKINEILGDLGNLYEQENSETLEILKNFKEIVK